MLRTGSLEGSGFAGKLKGDNMNGWELESSDADSMELEGAQVESSEGGKIAEQVKSSDAEGVELEGEQLESLKVVVEL
jgi:hypothetical protein